jgi:hypothetical protein
MWFDVGNFETRTQRWIPHSDLVLAAQQLQPIKYHSRSCLVWILLEAHVVTDSGERRARGMSFPQLCILMTYEIFLEGKMSSILVNGLSIRLLSESRYKQMPAFIRQVWFTLELSPWIPVIMTGVTTKLHAYVSLTGSEWYKPIIEASRQSFCLLFIHIVISEATLTNLD